MTEKEIVEPMEVYVKFGRLLEYLTQFGISRSKLIQIRKAKDFPTVKINGYSQDRYDWRAVRIYLKL